MEDKRLQMLAQPHIKPLEEYRLRIMQELPGKGIIPHFDPLDGGINAIGLILAESPGTISAGTAFISRENPDSTAKNFREVVEKFNIDRQSTIIWNIVPWYVADGKRKATDVRGEIDAAQPYLHELIHLLPQLKAILLLGSVAKSVSGQIRGLTNVPIIGTHLMTQRVYNLHRHTKPEVEQAFEQFAAEIRRGQ